MDHSPSVWLEQIAEGSVTAFGQFYDAYAPLVYRIALSTTRDEREAEDVCQELFLEVMNKAGQYDPARGSVEAWLAVRARSRAMDRLRKKQRETETDWIDGLITEASWATEPEAVEVSVFRRLEAEKLKRALLRIPAPQRMAVYGCYVEELSHSEMARMMNRPLGTIKSLIRYGLRNIRRVLEAEEKQPLQEGGAQHESVGAGA